MFYIDYLDSNNLRRKEVRKILLEENFVVKTFNNDNDFFLNTENFKLIAIVDLKNYEVLKSNLLNYKCKEKIFVIIDHKFISIVEELKKIGVKNLIPLPLKRIKDLTKIIFDAAQKIGLITDKKNKMLYVLNKTNKVLSKCSCIDPHELDTLRNDINLLSNILKQHEDSKHKFSGSLQYFPLYEVLKFIQNFVSKGVLSISSETINADIIISGEAIINCVSKGQINALKTFEFLSTIEKGTFSFSEHFLKNYSTDKNIIRHSFSSLIELSYKTYSWYKINKNKLPLQNLKLKVLAKNFEDNKFKPKEIELLAGIIEYTHMKDLISFNKLNLIDTYETLISLRKRGFLEVLI